MDPSVVLFVRIRTRTLSPATEFVPGGPWFNSQEEKARKFVCFFFFLRREETGVPGGNPRSQVEIE